MRAAVFAMGCLTVLLTVSAPVLGDTTDHDALARRYEAEGKLPEALAAYRAAQAESPGDLTLSYNLGRVHYRLGDFQAAANAFLKVAQAGERQLVPEASYNAGNAYYRLGKYSEAVTCYKRTKVNLELAHEQLARLSKEAERKTKSEQERPDRTRGGKEQRPPSDDQAKRREKTESQRKEQPPGRAEGRPGERPPGEMAPAIAEARTETAAESTEISFEDALRLLETLARQERNHRLERARRAVQTAPGSVAKDW